MSMSGRRAGCFCAAALLASVSALGAGVWASGVGRSALAAVPQAIPLASGMVIDHSVVIRPGRYELMSADLDRPAIRITGENITVDFNGAELIGSPASADPDTFAGTGILVDGGRRITIKNATVRGYKVGILARRSPDLRITGNNLSYNWKQRLYSGIAKESLVDWMSYHQNEKDEWLRYGAAIYMTDCDRAEIDHNTVVQGQNGLMATRAGGLKIWNNTFQFLSSIGVGLYRVTNSAVMHNRIDWCVRGYSHGFYNRGQDSAGLLMYEQSSGNRVAYNSITHGGDGLFLWAGQSTMDTGKGGANDNYFYGNDFSHAPTNGIEATFSRNTFVANRVEECWHGVWGGYSWDSKWIANRFARNTEGIAIEHGQNNQIVGNTFDADETAIRLWQNARQDPNWGYPRNRDTRSAKYLIALNRFSGNKLALDLRDTVDVTLQINGFRDVAQSTRTAGVVEGLLVDPSPARHPGDPGLIAPEPTLPGGMDPMIKDGGRRGRQHIIVDEWGPYDGKSPKLWPSGKPDDRPLRLRVLGPEGAWTVAQVRGATVEPQRGTVPGEVVVTPSAEGLVDFDLTLEYRGAAVTSPRGDRTAAGSLYRFGYRRFAVTASWQVKFFAYDGSNDPVKQPDAFARLLSGSPLKQISTGRLDYISGGALEEGVPRDRFAIRAEGAVDLPPGDYTLRVISDDGVRVWLDESLVMDVWTPHESRVDEVRVAGGRRKIRLDYYEVDGFAELRLDIQPVQRR
jgi:nitrous oxidase accessory protein NosD